MPRLPQSDTHGLQQSMLHHPSSRHLRLVPTSGGSGVGGTERGRYRSTLDAADLFYGDLTLRTVLKMWHQGLVSRHPVYRLTFQKATHQVMSRYWRWFK